MSKASESPAVHRIQRTIDDSKRAGGMSAGLPKIQVDLYAMEYVLKCLLAYEEEIDCLEEALITLEAGDDW